MRLQAQGACWSSQRLLQGLLPSPNSPRPGLLPAASFMAQLAQQLTTLMPLVHLGLPPAALPWLGSATSALPLGHNPPPQLQPQTCWGHCWVAMPAQRPLQSQSCLQQQTPYRSPGLLLLPLPQSSLSRLISTLSMMLLPTP